jgi:hypothetical protein
MNHDETWAHLWDPTAFERLPALDDAVSARIPAPEAYEAAAPTLWTLDANEGQRFSDTLRLFGRQPDRSTQLPSLRRAFEVPPMFLLWVVPFAAIPGDFTSGPLLVAADGVYALAMDGKRYVLWCGWKDVAGLTLTDLGDGLRRMTLIGRERAGQTAFTAVRPGECDHFEIVAAIRFQWREVVDTVLTDGGEIDVALRPSTAVSDTWERLGFRLRPVPTVESLREWIAAGATVDDLPTESQLRRRASFRQATPEGDSDGEKPFGDPEVDYGQDADLEPVRAILLAAVRECLDARGLRYVVDDEGGVVFFIVKVHGEQHAIDIRIDAESRSVVVLIQNRAHSHAPEDLIRETQEFASYANWSLRSGSFDVDPRDGEIRFRIGLPIGQAEPSAALVDATMLAAMDALELYSHGFTAVACGIDPGLVFDACSEGEDPLLAYVNSDEGNEEDEEDEEEVEEVEEDFEDEFETDDDTGPIGEEGSSLATLSPILRSWERVWRARWQPSEDGRWEVSIPSSFYRAPDGSNRLHLTVASTDDGGVRLTLPDFIELLPDFDEGMQVFKEALGSLGRPARYEYDRASGRVSAVTDFGRDSASDGSIYRTLGDLRPVFDGQFMQFLNAQGAALAAMTEDR